MTSEFGHLLKAQRKAKNLTLKELAQKTDLSPAYLSLLERNLNNPTVENLNRVCTALDLTLADLIEQANASSSIVVKATERDIIFKGGGYMYEAASKGQHKMDCLVMTISDTNLHVSNAHIVDEIGFVLSGSITLNVSGTEYPMSAGDCIYIEANQHHSYYKTSKEDCVSLWVCAESQSHDPPRSLRESFLGTP